MDGWMDGWMTGNNRHGWDPDISPGTYSPLPWTVSHGHLPLSVVSFQNFVLTAGKCPMWEGNCLVWGI